LHAKKVAQLDPTVPEPSMPILLIGLNSMFSPHVDNSGRKCCPMYGGRSFDYELRILYGFIRTRSILNG